MVDLVLGIGYVNEEVKEGGRRNREEMCKGRQNKIEMHRKEEVKEGGSRNREEMCISKGRQKKNKMRWR